MVIQNGKLDVHAQYLDRRRLHLHGQGRDVGGDHTEGVFHIFGVIDGLDVDSLGRLWRPRSSQLGDRDPW